MSDVKDSKSVKKKIEDKIINVLKAIFDPEIPVDIYELGLVMKLKLTMNLILKLL